MLRTRKEAVWPGRSSTSDGMICSDLAGPGAGHCSGCWFGGRTWIVALLAEAIKMARRLHVNFAVVSRRSAEAAAIQCDVC